MDYSLQMAGGVAAAIANQPVQTMALQPTAADIKKIEYFITSMEDSTNTALPHAAADTATKHSSSARSKVPRSNADPFLWVLCIGGTMAVAIRKCCQYW